MQDRCTTQFDDQRRLAQHKGKGTVLADMAGLDTRPGWAETQQPAERARATPAKG